MSRSKLAAILFAIFCLGAVYAGCGGDDGATEEQLQQAKEAGAKEAEAQAKVEELQSQVNELSDQAKQEADQAQDSVDNSSSVAPDSGGGSATGSTAGFTACTDGVKAGPNTTCGFAMNVSGEFGSNPGATSVSATSPTTGKTYSMQCLASGSGTICAGGDGATVFIP